MHEDAIVERAISLVDDVVKRMIKKNILTYDIEYRVRIIKRLVEERNKAKQAQDEERIPPVLEPVQQPVQQKSVRSKRDPLDIELPFRDTEKALLEKPEDNGWKSTIIRESPDVVLIKWQIFEVFIKGKTTRHFVGYSIADHRGRVSSPILEFDYINKLGRTASGKIYKLEGPVSEYSETEYSWSQWCSKNGVTKFLPVVIEDIDDIKI